MNGKNAYLKYLQSNHWKQLRKSKLDEAGRICCACQNTTKLQVHHLRYKNWVDCETPDLLVLCDRCHGNLHESMDLFEIRHGSYSESGARLIALGGKYGPFFAQMECVFSKATPPEGFDFTRADLISFICLHSTIPLWIADRTFSFADLLRGNCAAPESEYLAPLENPLLLLDSETRRDLCSTFERSILRQMDVNGMRYWSTGRNQWTKINDTESFIKGAVNHADKAWKHIPMGWFPDDFEKVIPEIRKKYLEELKNETVQDQ